LSNRTFVLSALALACLGIYLFATAPAPLPQAQGGVADIPVARMLAALQGANEAARELWTRDIVQAGGAVGLKFDERWREAGVEAGPLPALFLRETARSLERHPVRLSLFLGSDFPIAKSNAFEGEQLQRFRLLREQRAPQFFYVADTALHTGMFVDLAVTEACVDCHNEHPQTPKRDWRLGDVMGAVTWSYPAETVSLEEFQRAHAALYRAVREAYEAYLARARAFSRPPGIGERWPRDGYFLPDAEVFMAEVYRRTAPGTLALLDAFAERQREGTRRP
jgi:hypothetical protein